jgi:glutathione synthase/RimK-type ligase-like ATP-grasp enzyme
MKPIAIYHEHPDWFRPLFAELDRRKLPYVRLDASAHSYDPAETEVPWSVVVNRASPSAYLRGNAQSTFHTLNYFRHLERIGVPVINGSKPYETEISKAWQLDILRGLGLPYPKTIVVNSAERVLEAAAKLRYPVLVKANIGGSGAGIVKYDDEAALRAALDAGRVALGIDSVALVQEAAPLRDGHITRIELLGGKFLYAIDVFPAEGSFDLCPADICQTTRGESLARAACAIDAPKNGMTVQGATPPAEIIAGAEKIAQAIGLDIGGIEYLVDDRDGKHYFYDVNALSNFVADAPRVIGFDPWQPFVDFIEARAERRPGRSPNGNGSSRPGREPASSGAYAAARARSED